MIAGENSFLTQIRCRHGEKLKTLTITQNYHFEPLLARNPSKDCTFKSNFKEVPVQLPTKNNRARKIYDA